MWLGGKVWLGTKTLYSHSSRVCLTGEEWEVGRSWPANLGGRAILVMSKWELTVDRIVGVYILSTSQFHEKVRRLPGTTFTVMSWWDRVEAGGG